MVLCRTVLDVLLDNLQPAAKLSGDQVVVDEPLESCACHVLGLLAHLLTQPTVKSVFLLFTRPGSVTSQWDVN